MDHGFRAGRDDDAAAIIGLITACWDEYPGCVMDLDGENPELRALASHFAAKGGALWVAEQAGGVVGMVATSPHGGGVWELHRMYVSATARGGGLASALLHTAEDHARAHGATAMELWSDTRFLRAHSFYEKHSWLRDGPIRALGDVSNSLEFCFRKPLIGLEVAALNPAAADSARPRLAVILRSCVDAGASVSFLPPLARKTADAFWQRAAHQVAVGERVLLVAWLDGELVGTVMLDLATPANQPHRAEVQKMLVLPQARRAGVARALMQAVQSAARAAGRTLLTLDTTADSAGEALYRSQGWIEAGRIPGYALDATGTAQATVLFYRQLA